MYRLDASSMDQRSAVVAQPPPRALSGNVRERVQSHPQTLRGWGYKLYPHEEPNRIRKEVSTLCANFKFEGETSRRGFALSRSPRSCHGFQILPRPARVTTKLLLRVTISKFQNTTSARRLWPLVAGGFDGSCLGSVVGNCPAEVDRTRLNQIGSTTH